MTEIRTNFCTGCKEAADRVAELEARVADLESVMRVFVVYSSDSWVREQAQEALEAV